MCVRFRFARYTRQRRERFEIRFLGDWSFLVTGDIQVSKFPTLNTLGLKLILIRKFSFPDFPKFEINWGVSRHKVVLSLFVKIAECKQNDAC